MRLDQKSILFCFLYGKSFEMQHLTDYFCLLFETMCAFKNHLFYFFLKLQSLMLSPFQSLFSSDSSIEFFKIHFFRPIGCNRLDLTVMKAVYDPFFVYSFFLFLRYFAVTPMNLLAQIEICNESKQESFIPFVCSDTNLILSMFVPFATFHSIQYFMLI